MVLYFGKINVFSRNGKKGFISSWHTFYQTRINGRSPFDDHFLKELFSKHLLDFIGKIVGKPVKSTANVYLTNVSTFFANAYKST